MEWLWTIVAVGLALFLWERRRSRKVLAKPAATTLGLNMASDRELVLSTLRRELANYMVPAIPTDSCAFILRRE